MNKHKSLVLVIIIVLFLTACGSRETSTMPKSSEIANDTKSISVVQTTQQSNEMTDNVVVPSEVTTEQNLAMTSFETIVKTQGGKMLSQKDIEDLKEYFERAIIPYLLSSSYQKPAEIDLGILMNVALKWELKGEAVSCGEEELKLLYSRYPKLDSSFGPLHKNEASAFDEVLNEYLGIRLQDTQKKGLGETAWLDEYKAYYGRGLEGGYNRISPLEGSKMPDGMWMIHWKEAANAWGSLEGIVKLKATGDTWKIVANEILPATNGQ